MKRCLITGASGFLGGELCPFVSEHYRVTAQGFRSTSPDQLALDLRDNRSVAEMIASIQPDLVIHCAAYRNPDFCEQNPDETRRLNVQPLKIFQRELPATTKICFISSDYVFEGNNPPYTEDSLPAPINEYGRSKREAEEIVLSQCSDNLVVRIPLLMGRGPTPEASAFMRKIYEDLRSQSEVRLDNSAVRHPTWVCDAAAAVNFLIQQHASGVYHYSAPEALTIYQATKLAAKALDLPADHIKPSPDTSEKIAPRPVDSTLSAKKIRALGYARFTPFADVIRRLAPRFR